jgi:Protein of unknown function (DUF3108)
VATCIYHSKVRPTLRFSLRLTQLTALLVSLTCTIVAQQRADDTPASFNANAYRVGERLTYNVDFSHFISVAHVELFVAAHGTFFDRDAIQLRAHVETTGVTNVALFAINSDYATFVDPETGLPFRSQQVVHEADRRAESVNEYNQPAGIAAIRSTPKTEFPGPYDFLSALYRIRAMPLAEGASYFISVHNEGDEYQAEVRVFGKELIKTNVGSFNAIGTRVRIKNGHDYDLRVYFTSDERHVPVLITAKLSAGALRAELAGSELTTPAGGAAPQVSVKPTPAPSPAGRQVRPGTPATTERPKPPLNLPFKVGEQLNYQVYLGTSPQSVGTINLSVKPRSSYFNHDGLQLVATAQTSGPGARVFPVNDLISSYVDPETLLPFRTELKLSEGKFKSDRAYDLDQNRGTATTGRQRVEIPIGTHDLLSALYAIRTFDLTVKKKNAISLMATDSPRTLTIVATRRETIELSGQKIPALFLELKTDDPQGDRMQIRVWVGDDLRHLPLRITAVTELGPARADLIILNKAASQ